MRNPSRIERKPTVSLHQPAAEWKSGPQHWGMVCRWGAIFWSGVGEERRTGCGWWDHDDFLGNQTVCTPTVTSHGFHPWGPGMTVNF